MQNATDLRNVNFYLSKDCVGYVFPNFVGCYSLYINLVTNYCHRNKATPSCNKVFIIDAEIVVS